MRKSISWARVSLLALLFFEACASKPAAPPSTVGPLPAPAVALSAQRRGFSPTSTTVKNSLDLLLSADTEAKAESWRLEIQDSRRGYTEAVRAYSGVGEIPDSIAWDGRDETGSIAAEGSYRASLSIDYGDDYAKVRVASRDFRLVTTPPSGSIALGPSGARLSSLGPENPVYIAVRLESPHARVAKWVLEVHDTSRGIVLIFGGGRLRDKIAWDGTTMESVSLVPGDGFYLAAKVVDEYGNIGRLDLHDDAAWERFFGG
jgi:hypothetical protein